MSAKTGYLKPGAYLRLMSTCVRRSSAQALVCSVVVLSREAIARPNMSLVMIVDLSCQLPKRFAVGMYDSYKWAAAGSARIDTSTDRIVYSSIIRRFIIYSAGDGISPTRTHGSTCCHQSITQHPFGDTESLKAAAAFGDFFKFENNNSPPDVRR